MLAIVIGTCYRDAIKRVHFPFHALSCVLLMQLSCRCEYALLMMCMYIYNGAVMLCTAVVLLIA